MKDVLLESSLPPNVLTKVSLTSTKLFRSIGDMHMPVNELIRVVKLYSTPWEEKSTALKKLHDGYEAKKSQLDIAIKRLQLVDAQSRRMHREKRIMNWEKLFCRITTARGHGRRWKFLIDSFKKKAKEGIPALQRYLDAMENVSDSEEEEETSDFPVETQMQQMSEPSEEETTGSEESEQEDDSSEASTGEPLPEVHLPTPVQVTEVEPVQTFIKPPMRDQQCSTSDPTYDRFLYVKVYNPQGLDKQQIKCSLVCGSESYKTSVLDAMVVNQTIDDNKSVVSQSSSEDQSPSEEVQAKPKKSRGLIGSRSSRGSMTSDKQIPSPKLEDHVKKQDGRHEEMLFTMPENNTVGRQKGRRRSSVNTQHLRVSVHHGPMDELLAMATIEIADLNTLDLPSVILPPDPLVADAVDNFDLLTLESDSDNESTTKSNNSRDTSSEAGSKFILPAKYRDVKPVNFPLYSIHGGPSDAGHVPCGQLPLVCFWAKKLRPKKFHKTTEADTLNEIVLDLTGINLEEVTKEDLHPDMVERSISAMSTTPEVKEETVSRQDYDRLMRTHQEEMEMLQDEYEQRLQDLAESMQHMQMLSLNSDLPQRPQSGSRPRSRSSNGTGSAEHFDERIPHPPQLPRETRVPTENAHKPKRSGTGKSLPNWRENLPKNFLERLRWFEELNNKHRQELSEKTNKEISDNYEKKLAGEFKLRGPMEDENSANPLDDVSLPAVFMPSKGRDLTIFNPRASKYFHATGTGGLRLTQPPSMVTLPPLPKNKVNVVNLFDVCNNFRSGGNEWLIQRYMQQEQQQRQQQQQHEPDDTEDQSYDADPLAAYKSTLDRKVMARETSAIYSSANARREEAILE